MAITAILYGVVLIVIGVVGYVASGAASITALIPAFIGLVAALCGALALNERFHKHAMHAASAVALIALLGTLRGIPAAFAWLGGTPPDRPGAVVSQILTALLSLLFVALAIRSFVRARRSA
jgi:hypothetical protein